MLRERLVRFLPVNPTNAVNLIPAAHPPLSDKELVELYLNLEFIPGDGVSGARSLYLQASQAELRSGTTLPLEVRNSLGLASTEYGIGALPEPLTAPQSEKLASTPAAADEVSESGPESGRTRSEEDSAQQSGSLTISAQTFVVSPSLAGLSPPLTFDKLVELGWIRTSWERFFVPRDIRLAVLHTPHAGGAFRVLVEKREEDAFKLAHGFAPYGQLHDIAAGVVAGKYRLGEIACVSRPWIAARLWDTKPSVDMVDSEDSAEQRISNWINRWELLNGPQFSMSSYVDSATFEDFVEAAMGVLRAPTTTPGWSEFARAAVAPTALLYPHRATDIQGVASNAPATTIDRVRWMGRGAPEAAFYEYLGTRGSSLLGVLLNELHDATWDNHRLGPRLMDLLVERPVLLMHVVQRARAAPTLLADMLMAPATCALACSLIVSWQFNDGGWNRAFQADANHATELLAFEDALAVLGGHLDEGRVPASEVAALYLHLYELASNPSYSSRRYEFLSLLRQELASINGRFQDAVVAALITFTSDEANSINAIYAALDLATDGGCVDRIEPLDVVSLYLDVVLPQGEPLRGRQLDSASALALGTLALRCNDSLRSRFLSAVDVAAWLGHAPSSPVEQDYTFRDLLARRIRLHIRVLARAIAGWPTEIPNELVDALAYAIRSGATDNLERGRVDAFVPRLGFGHAWAKEQPIALDLAAALRRLTGDCLQQVLTQLCQVDEPIVLAGVVSNTPATINAQLKAHLSRLTPETSPEVWSLPALQARVEALLSAGLPEAAEVFIAAERDAITFGQVPGREVSMLRAHLRILLLREDWAAIKSYALPDNLSAANRTEADDSLLFYQGVAEMTRAGGSPAAATEIFSRLTQRHRGVAAYWVNLFASRVQNVLSGDAFRRLSGEALAEARRYLVEAEREIRPLVQHSASDLKALDSNRAMLLLATGQLRESLQVLLTLRESNFEAHIEGFRALAMARLGSKREALAVLMQAERAFGRSEFLSAVRENIDTHQPYVTAPSLSLDDDPVPGIRHAFDAFTRLGHVEQAEVLQSQGRLDLYLLEAVRGACAAIVALAPMMKNLEMLRHEDDISSVLKQILQARLLVTQWAVGDQSRGGFSKSGGVGERDLIITSGLVTLAVLEALIVDSVETVNLTSHFYKLFGYDTCRFFFHITYARGSNCAGILRHLKTVCANPPSGINYLHPEELADFDSMPAGFKAHYEIDSRRIVVVFLVLDIGQAIQRAAARAQ